MPSIPTLIQFTTAFSPQNLSDLESLDDLPDQLDDNVSAVMTDEDEYNRYGNHFNEHEYSSSIHGTTHYESAAITSQDLLDLKAMVQRMKSNPQLVTNKVHELKSSLTTLNTAATMTTGGTNIDISPPTKAKVSLPNNIILPMQYE